MNTNSYLTDSEGPEILGSEILEFLIKRCNEFIQSDDPQFPLLLQGLAVAILGVDDELLATYKALLSSPYLPPKEIIRRCIEIFQSALNCELDGRPCEKPTEPEENREPGDKFYRHVLMAAAREARLMEKQSDFRYAKVIELLTWMGLQSDPEWLAEFEAVRVAFSNDPEKLVKSSNDILRDAIFKRRPSDRVRHSSN
jgi:hypothetical protein